MNRLSLLESARILVVDDDPIFNDYLESVFSLVDLSIDTCESLATAQQKLRTSEYDIILLDSFLGSAKGIELMPNIQALASTPLVIMVTTDEDIENIKYSFESGVSDYLIKPVKTDLLLQKVHYVYKNLLTQRELDRSHAELKLAHDTQAQEEKLAQYVYNSLIDAGSQNANGIRVMQISHSGFCGDFLFSVKSKTGNLYVFLADAMGHGLAAAICILPLIATAKAMAQKNIPMQTILHEINRKLDVELPDDRFVAMAAVEVNHLANEILVFNAGLPPVLVETEQHQLALCESTSMPMGIMPSEQFSISPHRFELAQVNQMGLFTDGLIEQNDANGRTLNIDGIKAIAEQICARKADLNEIESIFTQHIGQQSVEDDVTLCVINIAQLDGVKSSIQDEEKQVAGGLSLSLNVSGQYLRELDVMKYISQILSEARLSPNLSNRVFTVLAELFNNGLDHGVLSLDSALKNDVEGFSQFIEIRDLRLKALNSSDSVSISLRIGESESITIEVEDSGEGFDHNTQQASNGLSGRGLALIDSLTSTLSRNSAGNKVTAVLKIQEEV